MQTCLKLSGVMLLKSCQPQVEHLGCHRHSERRALSGVRNSRTCPALILFSVAIRSVLPTAMNDAFTSRVVMPHDGSVAFKLVSRVLDNLCNCVSCTACKSVDTSFASSHAGFLTCSSDNRRASRADVCIAKAGVIPGSARLSSHSVDTLMSALTELLSSNLKCLVFIPLSARKQHRFLLFLFIALDLQFLCLPPLL